jgi:hypothetical protein
MSAGLAAQARVMDAAASDGLAAVLECSERMCAAARAGRWDDLTLLERERRALLDELFSSEETVVDAPALRRLTEMNDEIIALGTRHRNELHRALEDGRGRRRAADAYRVGAG